MSRSITPCSAPVKAAFEEVVQETAPHWGIDGCSAPNFACSVAGLARAMQFSPPPIQMAPPARPPPPRLTRAMAAFPELVAGERLHRVDGGLQGPRRRVKTGAEAVFIAIIPEQKRGIALKIVDGGTRAAEAAIAALLVRCGLLQRADPAVEKRLPSVQTNWCGRVTGEMRLAPGFG
ncbi:MAG: asparaginase [Paracoccaceae bacterium]